MQYLTYSERQTEQLGQRVAPLLRPGDVVAYYGDLGAGKTAFTRGIAQGLGITEPVTSPTYTVVNEYPGGRLPLFHFDLYRLRGEDDLFDIGWDDYLERGGVCVVEWSEHAPQALAEAVTIRIDKLPGDDSQRQITITGGERFEALGI